MKRKIERTTTQEYRYQEQQAFLNGLAEKLDVVCYRPNYHADHDPNTVLFYTQEDHAHNCEVDKQKMMGYSRAQAEDLPYHIDDKYIYRDHFWCFENTDVNGHFNYDFANFGKLDLRSYTRWKEVIEGDVRFALIKKKLREYIRYAGGLYAIQEADQFVNDTNRELIAAYKLRYGTCYLGDVNIHNNERRKAVTSGQGSVYEEYTGQTVYNFGCDFVVPVKDEALEARIAEWNRDGWPKDASLVDSIMDRIDQIGGIHLIWY
ncbi:MAG: hypothetical protein E7449_01115 [Ruminococcaceae bacterium]|nr:hypothetical protein [Oscillospiraceae bacterium]